jgi:tRNA-Thr(GGU) m(6)t(6)A37 methyltransferase TsaA
MKYSFEPIAFVHSPFSDRFAVPRQPGLAESARGYIQFTKSDSLKTALKGLEGFSHLWIVFVFHDHGSESWKPSVRPPRLGGKKKVGVLATRSPHRPNPLGISCVEIEKIDLETNEGPRIHIKGLDLIDGTPVLDVKPYVPYADSFPNALSGWASEDIKKYSVSWSEQALKELQNLAHERFADLKLMIEDVLALDPRPAFQKRKYPAEDPSSQGMRYGFDIEDFDIKYSVEIDGFLINAIIPLSAESKRT